LRSRRTDFRSTRGREGHTADSAGDIAATDLRRIVEIKLPAVQVGYDLQEIGRPTLEDVLREHKFI
jgi:hypothetical protein